jgi:hypothetical protein
MSEIDLAVLGTTINTHIFKIASSHIIAVNTITTNIADFKSTFFNGNNFNIVTPVNEISGLYLIKIDNAKLDNEPEPNLLDLYSEVLNYAAIDLEIDPTIITNVSKVGLFKECHNLTMASLKIVSSLKWRDIEDIITERPIVITVVLTNQTCNIKNICIKFTYNVNP